MTEHDASKRRVDRPPASLVGPAATSLAAGEVARLAAALRAAASPQAEVAVIVAAWEADPTLAETTIDRLADLADRYARRLAATGRGGLAEAAERDAVGFVWAATQRGQPPSRHTLHLRRTTLRTLYRTRRQLTGDPTDPSSEVALPPKTTRTARPLDDSELALVRTAALAAADPLRAACAVALAEATATTGELARSRWADLDHDQATVQLGGAPPVQPRQAPLTGWGSAVLARAHASLAPDPGDPIIHRGASSPEGQRGQAAAANLLRRLLHAAGVAASDVRPTSIRLWAGRAALDRGARIETVAGQLGLASLDATAAAIAYQWHPDHEASR